MNERLKELRKELHLTQKEMAERMQLATNYIYLVETGKNAVTDKYIYRVCKEFGVNETWLRSGTGEMFAVKTREEEMADVAARIFKEDNPLKEEFAKMLVDMNADQMALLLKLAKGLVAMDNKKSPDNKSEDQ